MWIWLLIGCPSLEERDVCERAADLLHRCGVSLPVLTEGACVGTRVMLGDCVLANATDCTDVAELHLHYESCLDEALAAADRVPESVPYVDLGDTAAPDPEDSDPTCSDGLDNDGDGSVDCGDQSCLDSPLVTVCD